MSALDFRDTSEARRLCRESRSTGDGTVDAGLILDALDQAERVLFAMVNDSANCQDDSDILSSPVDRAATARTGSMIARR